MSLYPLKFKTIYKDKIWGGNRINTVLGKDFSPLPNCGESWELSCVEDNISVVENGFLAENTLDEVIEIYMSDLVGEKIYEQFGLEFPLLIKFIDANDWLSIQVHPDDSLAKKRHNSFGKNEMWYILHAEEGAQIISGFNKKMDKNTYSKLLNEGNLKDVLQFINVKTGDVFDMPAGRIHALGPGICLAEIQQTSDITYRIYDWERTDEKGNSRQLHTEEALDTINYNDFDVDKIQYQDITNKPAPLVHNNYYKTNLLHFTQPIARDYSNLDSFVIYICTEGNAIIETESGKESIQIGETILIPAIIDKVILYPTPNAKIIEVYVELPEIKNQN